MPDRSRVSTCSSIRVNFLSIVKKLIDRTLITDDQASFFEMKFYANVEESLSIRYGVIGRQKKKKRKEKKRNWIIFLRYPLQRAYFSNYLNYSKYRGSLGHSFHVIIK